LPCRAFHLRPGVGLEIDDHDATDAQLRIAGGGLAQVTASGLQLEDALLQQVIDRRLRVVGRRDAAALRLRACSRCEAGADETDNRNDQNQHLFHDAPQGDGRQWKRVFDRTVG
jgi:hypothetical protein